MGGKYQSQQLQHKMILHYKWLKKAKILTE